MGTAESLGKRITSQLSNRMADGNSGPLRSWDLERKEEKVFKSTACVCLASREAAATWDAASSVD